MTVVLNLVAGGGNRYINNTSKKRSKSHDGVGKPKKIYSKSGNKINQIAANFNQNIDAGKTRPRGKSVGMSTGAKVGFGVGGTLVAVGAATGLGLFIRECMRRLGECDLLRNYSLDCINSSDLNSWNKINYKISFVYDRKDSKNYKKYVLNFFLVKDEYDSCYLLHKTTEDLIENGITRDTYVAKDGGLENLDHIVAKKTQNSDGNISLSVDTNPSLSVNTNPSLLVDINPYGSLADEISSAFHVAAKELAYIIVQASIGKSDDRETNMAYYTKESVIELMNTMKDRILKGLGDTTGNLVFTVIKRTNIARFEQSGWSVIRLV